MIRLVGLVCLVDGGAHGCTTKRLGLGPSDGMALKRVHLTVRGRVQGVFLEAAAQREARRLGLTGMIVTRHDGSLELTLEGEEEPLREFIAWSQKGPSAARVEEVDVRWASFSGQFSDVRVLEQDRCQER